MFSKKRFALILFVLILLVGGLAAGVVLVGQRQEIAPKASTPGGTAYISLNPTTKTVNPGETFPVQINFTTGGAAISAITAQIDYDYTGSEPPLVAGITPNPALTQDGDWSFPIKIVTVENGHVTIRIAAVNVTQTGYNNLGETLFATLNFSASNTVTGSITALFDATQSKITRKDTAEDILMMPSSTGTYIVAAGDSPTATPTPPGENPTATPTPPSYYPTATPTPRYGYSSTATPTPPAVLPQAGSAATTLAILSSGLAILAAGIFMLLAL